MLTLPYKKRKYLVFCCMWMCGLVPPQAEHADQENHDVKAAQRCWASFRAPKLDKWTCAAAIVEKDSVQGCCPPFGKIGSPDAGCLPTVVDSQLVAWSAKCHMPLELAHHCIAYLLNNTGVDPGMVKGLTHLPAFTLDWNKHLMPDYGPI